MDPEEQRVDHADLEGHGIGLTGGVHVVALVVVQRLVQQRVHGGTQLGCDGRQFDRWRSRLRSLPCGQGGPLSYLTNT